jgi:hypothetical protein
MSEGQTRDLDATVDRAFKIIAAAALNYGNKITREEAVDLIDAQLVIIRGLLSVIGAAGDDE